MSAPGEPSTESPRTPIEAPGPALAATFPALARLLGPSDFAALCAAAAERAPLPGVPSETSAGAQVHGLIVHGAARRDDRIPSRLAADIAALEWSIRRVTERAPLCARDRRAGPADLELVDRLAAHEGGWRAASLQPLLAFDLVPVAFRLENWVRRVHDGRRVAGIPLRGEQHVVVYARPVLRLADAPPDDAATGDGATGAMPAIPWRAAADDVPAPPEDDDLPDLRYVALPPAWWFALPPGPGRLLAQLALGAPLGLALEQAVTRGELPDEAAGRACIEAWLREGLFTAVLRPAPAAPPAA